MPVRTPEYLGAAVEHTQGRIVDNADVVGDTFCRRRGFGDILIDFLDIG
jgi:hypothetical protein